jgi:Zn-dependent peptidase ImmA (M78 family)
MSQNGPKELHNRRSVLCNPYAHIEQLVEIHGRANTDDAIHASRHLLQNPYAYLDENGGFSVQKDSIKVSRRKLAPKEIEAIVIKIQRRLWLECRSNSSSEATPNPIDVLDPVAAAKLYGFELDFVNDLGFYADRAEKVAVAGQLDRSEQSIRVSRAFSTEVTRFTAAHEIGHLVLHPHLTHLHRDRPADGSNIARDEIEIEADKFASYFLMPEKLLRKAFVDRFLTESFSLNDQAVYALSIKYENIPKNSRLLADLLSTALFYNGKQFPSLAEAFKVSRKAMAIRLKELQLINFSV